MIPWTELFGPRRFLLSICEDLRQGACVVVVLPRIHPRNVVAMIEHFVLRQTRLSVVPCRYEESESSADAVYRACHLRRPEGFANARTLAHCDDFADSVVLIDAVEELDSERWHALIARYSDLLRNLTDRGRGLLCLVVREESGEPPSEGPALRVRRWRDVVSSLDVRTFVRGIWNESSVGPSGLREHLREALIAELAGGDLDLAALLHELEIDDLLSPHSVLRAYAERSAWSLEHPPCVAHGSIEIVDGRARPHAARLAIEDARRQELGRHLWRAGVQVLFPYIEDERFAAISRWRSPLEESLRSSPLRTSMGRLIASADELEVAHLVERLNRVASATVCEWLRLLADIRNDLAHLRPATTERVLRLLQLATDSSLAASP